MYERVVVRIIHIVIIPICGCGQKCSKSAVYPIRCVFVVFFIYLLAERGGLAEIIHAQNIKTSLSRR